MNHFELVAERRDRRWIATAVFAFVLVVQLTFVARMGTDIPLDDQWDVEGRWLFPTWLEGGLQWTDLLTPLNEHRIVWTHALNLALFAVNRQWDPLVQLVAIAAMRAGCAAVLAWALARGWQKRARIAVAVGVAVMFLPHLAWHSVLWGIETQIYFALGLSLIALGFLAHGLASRACMAVGFFAGLAAMCAMAPAMLLPIAVFGLALIRAVESGSIRGGPARLAGVAGGWLLFALVLHPEVQGTADLRAASPGAFVIADCSALAWPHTAAPAASAVMSLPLVVLVILRCRRRRAPPAGEDFVLLTGGWSVAVALAVAWARGGASEMSAGVPSRYVDFLVLLPLTNAACAGILLREAPVAWRERVRGLAAAWFVFAFVGWAGLSTEVVQRLVLPRVRDRDAPVRLAQEFQRTGDVGVFVGQPRLLVPHPHPEGSVSSVLKDPRMRGALPPSLQPSEPIGPLSWVVRVILGRPTESSRQ